MKDVLVAHRACDFLNSVLARSDQTYSQWKENSPPTFTRLYDVSEHAPVDDVDAPPSDLHDGGKFIHAAPVVMDHPTLQAAGVPGRPALPGARKFRRDTVYFVLSTWTPYNVWLMKTRFVRTR